MPQKSIPLIGSDARSDGQGANYQRLLNMMEIDTGVNGRSATVLKPTSGLKEIADLGGRACRGIIEIGSYHYVVCDDKVYKLEINAIAETCVTTLLGTINSTTGQVKFAYNPTQLIIVDSSASGYIVTLSTGVLTTIADGDFLGGLSVIFCDGYFVYCKPDTGSMFNSDLNDGTSWNALDTAIAESKPDNLVGLAVNKGEIWAFGTDTVEVWFNEANSPGFIFSPRVGSEIDVGCAAPGSIVELNNLIMWLDSRGFVVQSQISAYVRDQSSGYDLKVVSNTQMNSIFANYDVISDAIACSYVERGHIIYQITFPSEHITWCCDTAYKEPLWFQKGTYSSYHGEVREHLVQYTAVAGNTNVGCGYMSGKIYLMKNSYYTDDEIPIIRSHSSAPIFSDGNLIRANSLTVKASVTANSSGDGSDPQIELRYSNDGYHSWSNYITRDLGQTGHYGQLTEWSRLGIEREWEFELTIVEPCDFTIIEGILHYDLEKVE